MEDSVVTTRSLQWGQRILTAATDKFQKRAYAAAFIKVIIRFAEKHNP